MQNYFTFIYRLWILSLFFVNMSFSKALDFSDCSITPDIQTQKLLKTLQAEGVVELDEQTVKKLQDTPIEVATQKFPLLKKIENFSIPTPTGQIKARFYFPLLEGPLPVFVFYHGGGWALGSLDEYDTMCQTICYQTPCLLISVDYRLAPRYQFPTPLNDCYFVTQWLAENIQRLGGDPTRLAIGGDSAGGNLAAAVTLMARDRGTPNIQHQVLLFPALNAQFDTLSYFLFSDHYFLTRKLMQFFWKTYLPKEADRLNPYACPLQASTLKQLPSTLMIIANLDPLRDEGLAYAWRLHQDQVPVQIKRYPSIHGFIGFDLDVARQALKDISQYLHHAFETTNESVSFYDQELD